MARPDHEHWKPEEVARLIALLECERRSAEELFAALPIAAAVVDEGLRLWRANREFVRRLGLEEVAWGGMRLPESQRLEQAAQRLAEGSGTRELVAWTGGQAALHRLDGGRNSEFLLTLEREAAAPVAVQAERRRQRREQEQEKQSSLRRLSGRIAHAANNLLMIVGGYAEDLLGGLPPGDARRAELEEILRASTRLATLTTQLTAYARPAAAGVERFAWSEWRARFGRPSGAEADWVIEGNATLMSQLVEEVLRIAAPALHLGVAPELRLRESPVAGVVEITLSLPGLPAEMAARLLEPFAAVREGDEAQVGPAALLAPLEQAGVEVDLDTEGPALVMQARAQRAAATAHPAARARILVVEDEDGIRALIEKTLTRDGYHIFGAARAAEALALSRRPGEVADILISDLILPGSGGRELAEQLRSVWPGLRVLFITGHHDDPLVERQLLSAEAAGATLLLRKPFTLAELQSAVDALAGGHGTAAAAGSA